MSCIKEVIVIQFNNRKCNFLCTSSSYNYNAWMIFSGMIHTFIVIRKSLVFMSRCYFLFTLLICRYVFCFFIETKKSKVNKLKNKQEIQIQTILTLLLSNIPAKSLMFPFWTRGTETYFAENTQYCAFRNWMAKTVFSCFLPNTTFLLSI